MTAADEARAEASERTFPFSPTAALAFKMGWDACAEWRSRDAEVAALTAQLQAAQAAIKAHDDGLISDCYFIADDTSALDAATRAAKAEGWDGCLDTIEQHDLNTEQARAGNPYRTSPEQTEAE